jgi:MraZ protein
VAFLTGEYYHAIDAKGRLTIPAKLRESINTTEEGFGFVGTRGFDNILYLYTPRQYRDAGPQLHAALETNEDVRRFKRLRYGMAELMEVDNLGRILIPERMLKRCGLAKDVALIGCEDHIEVWNRAGWDSFCDENAPQHDDLSSRVMSLAKKDPAPGAPVSPASAAMQAIPAMAQAAAAAAQAATVAAQVVAAAAGVCVPAAGQPAPEVKTP